MLMRIERHGQILCLHLALNRRQLFHHNVVRGVNVGDLFVRQPDAHQFGDDVALRRTVDDRVNRRLIANRIDRAHRAGGHLAVEAVAGDLFPPAARRVIERSDHDAAVAFHAVQTFPVRCEVGDDAIGD